MENLSFNRRSVEKSFRKFEDILSDVMQANSQTWPTFFDHLILHCETDSVMQVFTTPLRENPNVDIEGWYNEFSAQRGMVGSSMYTLPADDDDRSALLYQFFLKVNNNEIDFISFCVRAYGHDRFEEMVDTFNSQLVSKFAREVGYKFEEIFEGLGDQQQISSEAIMVFQNYGSIQNVQGGIYGSNVASGEATISNSTASFSKGLGGSELSDILIELRENMKGLPDNEQSEGYELIDAIEGEVLNGGSQTKIRAFATSLIALAEGVAKELVIAKLKVECGLAP